MIATDLGTAQELFGEPGAFDSIVVAKSTDVRADELAVRLQSALADDQIEVLTGEADTADKQAELREDLKFFNTFLLAFAYISLFVGMFIIYNTFSIVIAQRTRDLAMLRAIGAGRRQVLRSVLLEAVAVGLVACAAGLGLGIGMSFGLRELLAKVGLDIPSGPTVITAATIITSVVVGVVVTVASAVAPALRASRVAPIAALRDVAIDRSHLSDQAGRRRSRRHRRRRRRHGARGSPATAKERSRCSPSAPSRPCSACSCSVRSSPAPCCACSACRPGRCPARPGTSPRRTPDATPSARRPPRPRS